MNRQDVLLKLVDIFVDEFDDETIKLTEETTAQDIDEWDSLANINLVVSIEHEFGIKFSMKEVNNMKNIGEMIDTILERI